jgi:bacterioferritin-associated ferredoxin
MEARASLAVDQREEAIAEAARLGPATQLLIKQTRSLQGQVGVCFFTLRKILSSNMEAIFTHKYSS